MATPRATIIVDILVEHLEELDFLWGRRRGLLTNPEARLRDLVGLEERIEAHVQGLLVAGEALGPLVAEGLQAPEASLAFAAAYPLLRMNRPDAARLVLDAFLDARDGQLEGLGQALCHGPIASILDPLREAASSAEPPLALAASEVLSFQSRTDFTSTRVEPHLIHESPVFRRAAWKLVPRLRMPLRPFRYKKGVEDEDAGVRAAALRAAAWGRQPWLLDYCRSHLRIPSVENIEVLRILAMLGGSGDQPLIHNPRWAERLGPVWFEILGCSGHPAVIPYVLRGLDHKDPRHALAAGLAFSKITGCKIESTTRVTLPPEDGHEPDEVELEFLDEANLPNPSQATAFWKQHGDEYKRGTRWIQGREIGPNSTPEDFDRLDVSSRIDAYLRARFEGRWQGNPAELERFPHKPIGTGPAAAPAVGPTIPNRHHDRPRDWTS